jgi:superfamily I DNA/RNA helicase
MSQSQLAATKIFDSHLLISGEPASGKTLVLAQKIAHALKEKKAKAASILVFCRSFREASEFKKLLASILGSARSLPEITTPYGFGARILRLHGRRIGVPKNFQILHAIEQFRVVLDCFFSKRSARSRMLGPSQIMDIIDRQKRNGISAERFRTEKDGPDYDESAAQVFSRYEDALRKQGAADAEDLVFLALRLFRHFPKFSYLFVDDYDAITPAQQDMVNNLCRGGAHLFATATEPTEGDIGSLASDFAGIKTMAIADPLPKRTESAIHYLAFDEAEESQFIAEKIASLSENHELTAGDMAVLYRTRNQGRILKDALKKKGVESRRFEVTPYICKSEINDLIGFLRQVADKPNWRRFYASQKREALSKLLGLIWKETGYKTRLEEENSLESLAQIERMIREEEMSLDDFLARIVFLWKDEEPENAAKAVNLMTLSQAKGRHFAAVFISGFEEGLLPHYGAQTNQEALEQERRAFRRGVAAARRHLFLTSVYKRRLFGETWQNEVSRFIKELPKHNVACFVSERLKNFDRNFLERFREEGFKFDLVRKSPETLARGHSKFKVGDVIEHPAWGRGIVRHIDGDAEHAVLSVAFQDRERRLMARYTAVTGR